MAVGRIKAPDVPNDPKLVKAVERLLDPDEVSIKQFIELFKVPTKFPTLFGGKTQVRFREYKAQTIIRETIEAQWKNGEGGKVAGLKGRQDGLTTDGLLLMWERFCRGGGGVWNIFSYDTDAVKEAFRLLQSFRRQMPEWVYTGIIGGGGYWNRDSAMQLELVHKDGNVSMLQCLTAGDKRSGSGSAPRGVLFDEMSKWDADVKRDMTSMTEGWADSPGNICFIPFTGQGMEEAAKFFMRAHSGEEAGGYVAHFFPWIGHPSRTLPFKSEREKAAFVEKLGKDKRYGIKDELALIADGATPEELNWRRKKIPSPGIQWDLALMRREYPRCLEDALSGSSRTVFNVSEEILKTHKLPAARREEQARRGMFRLTETGSVFDEDPSGSWMLFEDVTPDGVYCFGADATSGRTAAGRDGDEPDFALGDFIDVWSGRTVAYCRAHWDGEVFGPELFTAAVYFNRARGLIENNTYGNLAIKKFCAMDFRDIEAQELLLIHSDVDPEPSAKFLDKRASWLGFDTHEKSKMALIGAIREYLLELKPWEPGTETPFSSLFVEEALNFEYIPRPSGRGKPMIEARIGHDDSVIAKGLACLARAFLLKSEDLKKQSSVNYSPTVDPLLLFYAAQADQQKRLLAAQGASPLGGNAF